MQALKQFINGRKSFAISLFLLLFLFAIASCSSGPAVENNNSTNSEIMESTRAVQVEKSQTPRTQLAPTVTQTVTYSLPGLSPESGELTLVLDGDLLSTDVPEITSTPTKTQTKTRTPTRTRLPTKTRVPSNTPTNTKIPATPVPQDAPVRIFIPASYSKITTPMTLLAAVIPGSGGNVHMQLTGENGRIILQKDWIFPYANGRRITIDEKFDLQISGVAESARLSIYTLDAYGRIIALSSEDILLISIGDTDLVEANNIMDAFTIRSPYPEKNIHHGIVEVRGITRSRMASTVYMELVDQTGVMVGSYIHPQVIQPSLEYQILDCDIQYQVKAPKWVRLIMHQIDIRTGKDVAIASMVLKIYP
jgi:hypothetical protein